MIFSLNYVEHSRTKRVQNHADYIVERRPPKTIQPVGEGYVIATSAGYLAKKQQYILSLPQVLVFLAFVLNSNIQCRISTVLYCPQYKCTKVKGPDACEQKHTAITDRA